MIITIDKAKHFGQSNAVNAWQNFAAFTLFIIYVSCSHWGVPDRQLVALWPMADEDGKKTKTKGKNKAGDKKVAAVAPTLDIDQVDNSSENMLRLFLIHCIDIVFP